MIRPWLEGLPFRYASTANQRRAHIVALQRWARGDLRRISGQGLCGVWARTYTPSGARVCETCVLALARHFPEHLPGVAAAILVRERRRQRRS